MVGEGGASNLPEVDLRGLKNTRDPSGWNNSMRNCSFHPQEEMDHLSSHNEGLMKPSHDMVKIPKDTIDLGGKQRLPSW